ncbi:Mini-ribonuclease 3 [Fervidobacterium thailandense]|uniref:Mini-ribonuclease 3 n=1 Tax=Fervidobacterium thailandense TaxID=1008305 RepID=UPI000AF481B2|nr:ribonuclease III domain-containing protein [Fervidobacterium thailandense]
MPLLSDDNSPAGFFPDTSVNPEEVSIDVLAYIGDAVFNLYAKLFVLRDTKVDRLHRGASRLVSRDGQSRLLGIIEPLLNEKELGVVRRGINSKGARRHGGDKRYMRSTGFEALVGYLYLTDRSRLKALLEVALRSDVEDISTDADDLKRSSEVEKR